MNDEENFKTRLFGEYQGLQAEAKMSSSNTICLFQVQEVHWQNKGCVLECGQKAASLTPHALLRNQQDL